MIIFAAPRTSISGGVEEGNFSTSPRLNGRVRYKETTTIAAEVEDRPLSKETREGGVRVKGAESDIVFPRGAWCVCIIYQLMDAAGA